MAGKGGKGSALPRGKGASKSPATKAGPLLFPPPPPHVCSSIAAGFSDSEARKIADYDLLACGGSPVS